jgi:hypothetical protein
LAGVVPRTIVKPPNRPFPNFRRPAAAGLPRRRRSDQTQRWPPASSAAAPRLAHGAQSATPGLPAPGRLSSGAGGYVGESPYRHHPSDTNARCLKRRQEVGTVAVLQPGNHGAPAARIHVEQQLSRVRGHCQHLVRGERQAEAAEAVEVGKHCPNIQRHNARPWRSKYCFYSTTWPRLDLPSARFRCG